MPPPIRHLQPCLLSARALLPERGHCGPGCAVHAVHAHGPLARPAAARVHGCFGEVQVRVQWSTAVHGSALARHVLGGGGAVPTARVRRSREATALESPREWPLAHPAVDSVHGRVGQGHASTCTGCSTEKAEREQELGGGQQRGVVRDKLAS